LITGPFSNTSFENPLPSHIACSRPDNDSQNNPNVEYLLKRVSYLSRPDIQKLGTAVDARIGIVRILRLLLAKAERNQPVRFDPEIRNQDVAHRIRPPLARFRRACL